MFYNKLTIPQQKANLPSEYQSNYDAVQIDRIEIDGNTIQGYFEYSALLEKTYKEQPTRSNGGTIPDIDNYQCFFTYRLIIKYNMMQIEDYRKLMLLLDSKKNAFTVKFYDVVRDIMVTKQMYAAPTEMPIIYQQYLKVLGIKDFSIELIGTNNDIETNTVTYDYNMPVVSYSAARAIRRSQSAEIQQSEDGNPQQKFEQNVSKVLGGEDVGIEIDGKKYKLSSPEVEDLLGGDMVFKCWNTKPDGSGFSYMDGKEYFIHHDVTLYAQWEMTYA